MNWKEVGREVARFAPLLGAALGGPAGASVGAMIATKLDINADPKGLAAQLRAEPDLTVIKLQELEKDKQIRLQELLVEQVRDEIRSAVENARDVNVTMQAEAKSEHWVTFGWRPAIGFAVAFCIAMTAITVFGAFAMAVFGGQVELLKALPDVLMAVTAVIGMAAPILGIASWHRGRMQVARVQK